LLFEAVKGNGDVGIKAGTWGRKGRIVSAQNDFKFTSLALVVVVDEALSVRAVTKGFVLRAPTTTKRVLAGRLWFLPCDRIVELDAAPHCIRSVFRNVDHRIRAEVMMLDALHAVAQGTRRTGGDLLFDCLDFGASGSIQGSSPYLKTDASPSVQIAACAQMVRSSWIVIARPS